MKDTGKTMAESFMLSGLPLVKVSNNRVQGHMQIKQMLADMPDGRPGLLFFKNCKHIIADLPCIQTDENNPNDCAKEPHDLTHTVDGLRYFCVSRVMPGLSGTAAQEDDEDEDAEESYESFMCGGEVPRGYIGA